MLSALNNESVQEGILCDLTKVFVCVHHDVTVQIKFLLKTGNANEWIKLYFRDRYQSVGGKHWNVNNNLFLYCIGTKHDVPQGSIQNFLYFLST